MAITRLLLSVFGSFNTNPTLQISQMDIKIIFKGILLRRKDGIDIYFVVDMDFLRFVRNRFFAADNKVVE